MHLGPAILVGEASHPTEALAHTPAGSMSNSHYWGSCPLAYSFRILRKKLDFISYLCLLQSSTFEENIGDYKQQGGRVPAVFLIVTTWKPRR